MAWMGREVDTAYHRERIDDDGIKVRTTLFVRNFGNVVSDIGLETKFLNSLHDAGGITQRIHKHNRTPLEWLHFLQRVLHRALANLGRDREEELAAFRNLTLDPHVALHEVDETFRNGET